MWLYRQSTGELFDRLHTLVGAGYAGAGVGRNNPAAEQQPNVGPIVRGLFHIGPAYTHPQLGPITMDLTPDMFTEMYGRSLFRMHGDSIAQPGHASLGCIAMAPDARRRVSLSPDRWLAVVE